MIYLQDFRALYQTQKGSLWIGNAWKDGNKRIIRCIVSFDENKVYIDDPFKEKRLCFPLNLSGKIENNLENFVKSVLED